MAVLIFLSGTTRARIIPSDLLIHMDRGISLLLPIGNEVIAAGLHLAHVCPAPRRLGRPGLIFIPERHECP